MAAGDETIRALYTGPGVVEVVFGTVEGVGILDEGREMAEVDQNGLTVLVSRDVLRYVGDDFAFVNGSAVTVDERDWKVRQVRKLNRLESEAVLVAAD